MNNIKIKERNVKPYFYSATVSKSNSSAVGSTESRSYNKSELIKHYVRKNKGDFIEDTNEIDDELPF